MATLMEKLKEFTREPEQEDDMENYIDPMEHDLVSGDQEVDERGDSNFDYNFDDEDEQEPDEMDNFVDPMDDQEEPQLGDENQQDDEKDEEDVVDVATENPDKQGLIRHVDGAHLVSKRRTPDDTYTELWMFTVDHVRDALKIRNDILAGTDIPTHRTMSDDEIQSYTSWSAGNVQMIKIEGLTQ